MSASLRQLRREDVAKHKTHGDLWVIIDTKVYDLSKFASMHPGGLAVLLDAEVAGRDATEAFFSLHRQEVLRRPQYARLQIGNLIGEEQQIYSRPNGDASKVPYAEPTWLSAGFNSPYFKDHHRKLQAALRKFVEDVIVREENLQKVNGRPPPKEMFEELGKKNIIAMRFGPGPHLKGRVLMDGIVKPEELDAFHEMIILQEFGRINVKGYYAASGDGTAIGLPPIINYAKSPLRERVVEEVFTGKKHVCLAISEAYAGSDVSGLRCTATKVAGGWIVKGSKKWITNATFADYFTVGCRTAFPDGGGTDGGMVVLLIPQQPGIEVKPIKTAYFPAAGIGYIIFEDVFVPDENVLGPSDGTGLRVILSNFNHERWGMAGFVISAQRGIVEECFKWVNQRKVWGRPLSSMAVIRSRLANMIQRVESAQTWFENITYQMTQMNQKQQSVHLAGQIALLKRYCTQTAQETARDAVQIFGGRGITESGMGQFIEHYHKTVVFDAVPGGAEDVLADLGVRQALKNMPKNTRL